jgi:hypothetical protein
MTTDVSRDLARILLGHQRPIDDVLRVLGKRRNEPPKERRRRVVYGRYTRAAGAAIASRGGEPWRQSFLSSESDPRCQFISAPPSSPSPRNQACTLAPSTSERRTWAGSETPLRPFASPRCRPARDRRVSFPARRARGVSDSRPRPRPRRGRVWRSGNGSTGRRGVDRAGPSLGKWQGPGRPISVACNTRSLTICERKASA